MEQLEKLYYESLPYLYAVIAALGFSYSEVSRVAAVAAIALAYSSIYIIRMRFRFRHGDRAYRKQRQH